MHNLPHLPCLFNCLVTRPLPPQYASCCSLDFDDDTFVVHLNTYIPSSPFLSYPPPITSQKCHA
ncbi:hypothetical protein B0T21DRAFT_354836 [Apiosordaria backusii]|uniref:Uncharacterized protein n=1 Tax=Apiosordaria backusii TaxID=314023 RepID=A0AA40EY44_9PEZI|nr:hypothetical protein B0T21DRAFT_354836 [Apiosordaria backusii]